MFLAIRLLTTSEGISQLGRMPLRAPSSTAHSNPFIHHPREELRDKGQFPFPQKRQRCPPLRLWFCFSNFQHLAHTSRLPVLLAQLLYLHNNNITLDGLPRQIKRAWGNASHPCPARRLRFEMWPRNQRLMKQSSRRSRREAISTCTGQDEVQHPWGDMICFCTTPHQSLGCTYGRGFNLLGSAFGRGRLVLIFFPFRGWFSDLLVFRGMEILDIILALSFLALSFSGCSSFRRGFFGRGRFVSYLLIF